MNVLNLPALSEGKKNPTIVAYINIVILVRAECVRQRNEVAIKLDIIFSSSSSLSLSVLSDLSRLGLWLAADFKGKPPHWLLGVNSCWSELNAGTSLMSYGGGRQT